MNAKKPIVFSQFGLQALSSWHAKSGQLVIVRRQKCYLRIASSLDARLISRQQNCRWWRGAFHLHSKWPRAYKKNLSTDMRENTLAFLVLPKVKQHLCFDIRS